MSATALEGKFGSWGDNERDSYRRSLSEAVLRLRDSLAAAPKADHESIVEAWAERQINRLDRLYTNLAMPTKEYAGYIAAIDRATIERTAQ